MEYSNEVARVGSGAVAQFKLTPLPAILERIQDYLRPELTQVEYLLSRNRRRRAHRRSRVRPRLEKMLALRQIIGEHNQYLIIRDAILNARRNMLRQLGDGLAWILLGGDTRLIQAAFDPTQTHFIPPDIGGLGQVAIRLKINETNQFLALECDLTRCLGCGDLCVQRINELGAAPLPLEIKTSGKMLIGTTARTEIFAPSLPLLEEIGSLLGPTTLDTENEDLDKRERRQVQDIVQRARLMRDLQYRAVGRATPISARHWDCVDAVLDRALQQGSAFDIPESKFAYFAVRNSLGDDANAAMKQIAKRLSGLGIIAEPDSLPALTSLELANRPGLSTYGLPVALWDIGPVAKAKVLTGGLIFGAAFERSIWGCLMEEAGVTWREEDGGWILGTGANTHNVGRREVLELTVGIAFSALSPREVVDIAKSRVNHGPPENGHDPIQTTP